MADIDHLDARDLMVIGELEAAHDELLTAVRQARRRAGLSVEELAEMLGWPVEAVIEFEGPNSDPYLSDVRRYAVGVGTVIRHTVRPAEDVLPIAG